MQSRCQLRGLLRYLLSCCITACVVATTTVVATPVCMWAIRRIARWLVESLMNWAWRQTFDVVWSQVASEGGLGLPSDWGRHNATVPAMVGWSAGIVTEGTSQVHTIGTVWTWVCLAVSSLSKLRAKAV